MQPVLIVAYFGIGLLQLAAITSGLESWLGLHWMIASFIAIFLGYLPVIGSVIGAFGAVYAWGWSWITAILLFFWPLVIFGALTLGSATKGGFGMLRRA